MSDAHRLVCLSCSRPFTAARRHALTCSNACRMRRHAQRRAALVADLSELAREAVTAKPAA